MTPKNRYASTLFIGNDIVARGVEAGGPGGTGRLISAISSMFQHFYLSLSSTLKPRWRVGAQNIFSSHREALQKTLEKHWATCMTVRNAFFAG